MKNEVCLIVAIGPNGLIGTKDGRLPWRSEEDFRFFKQTTGGWPVIFGENTYKNLSRRPLSNRLNIMVSKDAPTGVDIMGHIVFRSIEGAICFAKNFSRIFIAGGAMVYKYALEKDLVDRIFLSELDGEFSGDVYFPFPNFRRWLKDNGWKMAYSESNDYATPPVRFTEWIKEEDKDEEEN